MNSTHSVANIFAHQQELIDRFHPIERKNFPHTYPHSHCQDLDDSLAQDRIRNYAWRITEEVVEAHTAPHSHYIEELIDVLHFQVELFIFIGIPSHSLQLGDPSTQYDSEPAPPSPYEIVKYLGLAVNCLKNKAWKQSRKPTDNDLFYQHMRSMWCSLQRELTLCGLSPAQIHDAYLNKASINHNRISTSC